MSAVPITIRLGRDLLVALAGVYLRLRRGWWWRRNRSTLSTESIIMIVLAIVASLAGIAALCWLLFTLAVFALPFFAALVVGGWAYGTGSGFVGASIVGVIAAAAAFGVFQFLLLLVRPTWLKLPVVLTFATPAAVAGYHATLGIVRLTMPSQTWQVVFAVAGGIAVGITAFMRLTMAAPGPAARSVA